MGKNVLRYRILSRMMSFASLCILLEGCYTHQFFGSVIVPDTVRECVNRRFLIDEVSFEDQMGLPSDQQATVFPYLTESQNQIIEASNHVCAQFTNGDRPERLKLHVVLTKFHHEMDTERTLLYLCSFGTLPGLMTTDGEATVHIRNMDGNDIGTYSIRFYQWAAVTCYTPFALFCSRKSDSSAQIDEFTQTALFVKTTGKYGMMEQCQKSFGDTVAAGLSKFLKKVSERSAETVPAVMSAPLVPVLLLTTPQS